METKKQLRKAITEELVDVLKVTEGCIQFEELSTGYAVNVQGHAQFPTMRIYASTDTGSEKKLDSMQRFRKDLYETLISRTRNEAIEETKQQIGTGFVNMMMNNRR